MIFYFIIDNIFILYLHYINLFYTLIVDIFYFNEILFILLFILLFINLKFFLYNWLFNIFFYSNSSKIVIYNFNYYLFYYLLIFNKI